MSEEAEVYCRHCGAPAKPSDNPDWLCAKCEHYQDSMPCPTCHQPVRISLMPPELQPEAHEPEKEE